MFPRILGVRPFCKSVLIIRAVGLAHNTVFGKMQDRGGKMHTGGVKRCRHITKNYVSINNNILTKYFRFASISTMIFGISFFTFAFFSFFAFYFFGKRCVVRKA